VLEEAKNSFATSELELLDMGDLFSRVQALRTGTGTVEYGMAAVELELIIYSIQPFLGKFITTITYPPIGVEQSCGSQIRLGVPPVTGAGCATAGAENALVHPIQLGPILLALQYLLPRNGCRGLSLKPGLDALILVVEVGHVHHQVLNHEHVWQWRDRGVRSGRRDLGEAGESVAAVDVHCAGTADAFSARSAEGEGGVELVLDLDEGVENHGTALFQIDLVLLELRLRWAVWVPPVD